MVCRSTTTTLIGAKYRPLVGAVMAGTLVNGARRTGSSAKDSTMRMTIVGFVPKLLHEIAPHHAARVRPLQTRQST
jgi:hypothetical protein